MGVEQHEQPSYMSNLPPPRASPNSLFIDSELKSFADAIHHLRNITASSKFPLFQCKKAISPPSILYSVRKWYAQTWNGVLLNFTYKGIIYILFWKCSPGVYISTYLYAALTSIRLFGGDTLCKNFRMVHRTASRLIRVFVKKLAGRRLYNVFRPHVYKYIFFLAKAHFFQYRVAIS